MSRATYRFRNFHLRPDEEPDAEPLTFAMQCAVCGRAGAPGPSSEHALSWVWAHLREAPDHLTYRERITRPYRATPGEWR